MTDSKIDNFKKRFYISEYNIVSRRKFKTKSLKTKAS